jgi:hypothetical protein
MQMKKSLFKLEEALEMLYQQLKAINLLPQFHPRRIDLLLRGGG